MRRLFFIGIFACLFPAMAPAQTSAQTSTQASTATSFLPKDYLIPAPDAIPASLQPASPAVPAASYVVEYDAPDNSGKLIIVEKKNDALWNYDLFSKNYTVSALHSRPGHVFEKISDITYQGAQGALFHSATYNAADYYLILNDNGKMLRIHGHDGMNYHFTPDMMIGILNGLTRQS